MLGIASLESHDGLGGRNSDSAFPVTVRLDRVQTRQLAIQAVKLNLKPRNVGYGDPWLLLDALTAALAHDGPALVEVLADPLLV